jgi:hypothetical protein
MSSTSKPVTSVVLQTPHKIVRDLPVHIGHLVDNDSQIGILPTKSSSPAVISLLAVEMRLW